MNATGSSTSWLSQAATRTMRFCWPFGRWGCSATICQQASSEHQPPVQSYLLKNVSSRLTTRKHQRKLPVPMREGSDVYALMPDGTKIKLSPLEAVTHAGAWGEVIRGAFVHQSTAPSAPPVSSSRRE